MEGRDPAAALEANLGALGIGPGAELVVAFSGGADSLALLALLAHLPDGVRPAVEAIHVDHGLRPESAQEAAAALALARALGVRARVLRVDVSGRGGVEEAARKARYRALARAAGGRPVATAHTLDDQAETVLLRLARGAGLRGVSGMRASATVAGARIVRPLLQVRRAALRAVVDRLGLRPIEDPTNADRRFARNRLRAEVIPALEAIAPGSVRAIARFAALAAEDEAYLAARARRSAGAQSELLVARLQRMPLPLRRRALRDRIEAAGGRPPAAARIEEVLRLLDRGGDGELHLPGGVLVSVRAGVFRAASGPTGRRARRGGRGLVRET
jgi:tRNA(Ile)-lysidine synthase